MTTYLLPLNVQAQEAHKAGDLQEEVDEDRHARKERECVHGWHHGQASCGERTEVTSCPAEGMRASHAHAWMNMRPQSSQVQEETPTSPSQRHFVCGCHTRTTLGVKNVDSRDLIHPIYQSDGNSTLILLFRILGPHLCNLTLSPRKCTHISL